MKPASATLASLNTMPITDFVAALGAIYEHAPWVAEAVCVHRPFATIAALAEAMHRIVQQASLHDQLRLLRAHPALGQGGPLTAHSTSEQHDTGFDQITPERTAKLADLNRRYHARFGFPFIIAVRGQKDAQAIITQLECRLANDGETELATALHEVGRIAWFRLQSLEPSVA